MAKVTTRLQVMITPTTDAELERLARQHGQPKSALVRAVLDDLVERVNVHGEEDYAEEVLIDQAARETPPPTAAEVKARAKIS